MDICILSKYSWKLWIIQEPAVFEVYYFAVITRFKNIRPIRPLVFVLNSAQVVRKFASYLRAKLHGFANIHGWLMLRRDHNHKGRVKQIWYLSPMRAAKVQASLRIRTVSPEPPLLAHTSSESRATFRQKARSLAPLNGWTCTVKIFHDGMLEDTNSLDGVQVMYAPSEDIVLPGT